MVSSSFGPGGRGDDRSVHRTLAVGRHMLDMGYRSMVLANVSSILIYQPPRVTAAKLFFVLFATLAGAVAGALIDVSVTAVAIGAGCGLVAGLGPFIPKPPTSLMITGSDGGAAVFESNDMQFLQRAKAFLDARLNQDDLALTGFFDFANSRYSALQQEGTYSEQPLQQDAPAIAQRAPVEEEIAVAAPPPPRPAVRSAPAPKPAPTAAATPPAPPIDDPALDDEIDLSADNVSAPKSEPKPAAKAEAKAAPKAETAKDLVDALVANTANGARDAHFDALGGSGTARETGDDVPDEDTLPPIDFTRVMPQLAHVRRFYDETLQDADAVDQLDTMIVLMEEGAITEHSRQRIREIAATMQTQVETYPSIASIFAGIATRVGS